MTELVLLAVAVTAAAVLGLAIGRVLAPRIGRLADDLDDERDADAKP